jgi:hypothetical protein
MSSGSVIGRPFSDPIQRKIDRLEHWRRSVLGSVPNARPAFRSQRQGGGHAAVDLQLSHGVFAVAVDGSGLDAELACDLLGIEVGMDELQALPFPLRQPLHQTRHWSDSLTQHAMLPFAQPEGRGKGWPDSRRMRFPQRWNRTRTSP